MEIDPVVLKKITANPRPKCESCEDVSMTSIAYCFTCSILYCQNCWTYHQGILPTRVHNSITLEDALKKINNQERSQATHPQNRLPYVVEVTAQEAMKQSPAVVTACNGFVTEGEKLRQVLAQGELIKKDIQQQRKKVDSDIKAAFAKLRQILNQRQSVLLSESCHTAISKETRLNMQLEGLQQIMTAMSKCHNMAENAKTQEDWSQVQTRAEQLLAQFSDTSLELCENAMIPVEVETDKVSADIESFGYVATGACPSKSIMPDPPVFAVVGKEVTVSVHARSASGQGIGHGGEVVRGVLTKTGESKSQVVATTRDGEDGTYHLSIKPKVIGEHSLSVSVHGKHIVNSPFVFNVTRDYAAIKDPVQKVTNEVSCPRCVAFAGNSDILMVCHCGVPSVRVFDSSGRYKSRNGKQGSGDLEFCNPYGIAISGDTVYVADSDNHRIQILTTSGEFVGKFGCRGSGNNQFECPIGVCVDGNGMVYVGDRNNHRVQIFLADGTFSRSIDGNHSREGAFKQPHCLALGPNGDLHVTGHASNNIAVFSPNGKFVRSYEVKSPKGIAIDKVGFSLVSSNDTLSIFNPFGHLVKEMKGIGDAEAVAVSPDGSVWVSIHDNCLLKY